MRWGIEVWVRVKLQFKKYVMVRVLREVSVRVRQ